jgi:2'-5' RNA ligase
LNSHKNHNTDTTIRCFIAIILNRPTKKQLSRIQTDIRATGIQAGWPSAQNFHLTLKFLGNMHEQEVPGIKKILSKAVADKARFDITFNRLGVFPNARHPKIIWIGPDKPNPKLITLQQEIDSRLNKDHPLAKEKRFSPHITLSRVRHYSKPTIVKKAIGIKTGSVKISVDKIHLIKSRLLPSGAIHTSLFHTNLKPS